MAGLGSGVPKIFVAGAESLDNLPVLELSTLNQIKLRHNPRPISQRLALKFSTPPQFAFTEIHAPIDYSPRFLTKGVVILR